MAKSSRFSPSRHGFEPNDGTKPMAYQEPVNPVLGSQIRLGEGAPPAGSPKLAALARSPRVLSPQAPQPAPPPAPAPQLGEEAAPLIIAVEGMAPNGRKLSGEIEFPRGTQILGMRIVGSS